MAVVEQLPEVIEESDSPPPGFSSGLDNPDVSSACEVVEACCKAGQVATLWRGIHLIAGNCQANSASQQEG